MKRNIWTLSEHLAPGFYSKLPGIALQLKQALIFLVDTEIGSFVALFEANENTVKCAHIIKCFQYNGIESREVEK